MVVEGLKAKAGEVEEITASSSRELERLKNKFSSENTSLEKQQEKMVSLAKDEQQKMQKNLRETVEIVFARLSVVGLIYEQEEMLKFFLLSDDEPRTFFGIESISAYLYDLKKIEKIERKFNESNPRRDISFIGFNDLLSSIDKKYDIKNKKHSFYNSIKECQCFANFIRHKSQLSYNSLLKYPHLFSSIGTTIDKNHQEPILSLNTFYRYIRSFEKFWIHILKNLHKPMKCNEFIMKSHDKIDSYVQQYQERPWNKEGKIMDSI